jgi:stringent starvation protein B
LSTEPTSTKPYLLRAIYEWCVDNGFTPYISVIVDSRTRVPMEYVRDGEIVLNIGPLATNKMKMGNEYIECTARFSGSVRELSVPVDAVASIYARENGQGMSFEPDSKAERKAGAVQPLESVKSPEDPEPPKPVKPTLRRIK